MLPSQSSSLINSGVATNNRIETECQVIYQVLCLLFSTAPKLFDIIKDHCHLAAFSSSHEGICFSSVFEHKTVGDQDFRMDKPADKTFDQFLHVLLEMTTWIGVHQSDKLFLFGMKKESS